MKKEEIRDTAIAAVFGAIVGGAIVAFASRLPRLGLSDQYLLVQLVAFGALVGSLPVIAYRSQTPQAILVSIALSVTGLILMGAVVASSLALVAKGVAVASLAVAVGATGAGFESSTVPDRTVHVASIVVAAWLLSFAAVVLLALLSAGTVPSFTWAVLIVVVIAFLVFFDSIGREVTASRP
jgi:hypothetical protein